MSLDSQTGGVALLCDLEGNVVEVVRDELGVAGQVSLGRSLSLMVDRPSLGQALSFLMDVREHGVAFDRQIDVLVAGRVTPLCFAGAVQDDRLLVVGARTNQAIRETCDGLALVGDGRIEALGAAIGQSAGSMRSLVEEEVLDEFSRLNNELVTLQRELARKNAELEKLSEQRQRRAVKLERRVDRRTAQLQASEARFRVLFEQLAIGIVLVDTGGRVLDSNPALQRMVGSSAEELRDTHLRHLVSPADLEEYERIYRELSNQYTSHQKLEQRFTRPDGQPAWADVTLSLVCGPGGEPQFVIGIVEDVTERKKTQAALLRAEKLSIAGRLAASLTHEINNPLQTVIGCLGLAQEALVEGQDAGRFVQVGLEELRRVARLVADLRDLHRPPSEEEWEPETADVNGLVEQTLALTRKKCQQQGVGVTWRPAVELPALLLVPDRMQQVFLNVVVNALDAMPGGGQLDVDTEPTGQPPGVRVTFSDSGKGIPPDLLPRIFEPFHTSKPDGLGLGLFICQDIVRRHGGRIEVDSQEGQGTTVGVWLPA